MEEWRIRQGTGKVYRDHPGSNYWSGWDGPNYVRVFVHENGTWWNPEGRWAEGTEFNQLAGRDFQLECYLSGYFGHMNCQIQSPLAEVRGVVARLIATFGDVPEVYEPSASLPTDLQ